MIMINLKETVEYKEYGFNIVKCPVCGHDTLDNFWICEHCGWEYDGTKSEDEFSEANDGTIKEYKNYLEI